MKIIRKETIILVILLLISLLMGAIYLAKVLPANKQEAEKSERISHSPCLSDDEIAEYKINKKQGEVSSATIFVKKKETGKELFNFQIELPIPDHYHPIELHRCGVYAVRNFNYDFSRRQALSNYRIELWRYRYTGEGDSRVLLSDIPISGSGFGTDFRIDNLENYVVLERYYLGNPDYALVVKDLKTKEDVFVLTLEEVLKKYPDIRRGSFGLGIFTPDNKYLWGNIYEGAYDIAYYRIELGTWKTDILPSPSDLPSGAERDFNFKGWFAYVDITSFTGSKEITEQIEEDARQAGQMKNLWLYNLFTKEKIKIAWADPSWRFNQKWLSDNELEYYIPPGERKIYKTEE